MRAQIRRPPRMINPCQPRNLIEPDNPCSGQRRRRIDGFLHRGQRTFINHEECNRMEFQLLRANAADQTRMDRVCSGQD